MTMPKLQANKSARALLRFSAGTGRICANTQPTAQHPQQLTAFALKNPAVVSPTTGHRCHRAAQLHSTASTATFKSP